MSFVFNSAKGRAAVWLDMAGTSDALVIVPLEATGLETDEVLRDKATLADVLSGSTNEQTTLGRKTVTSASVTLDLTADRLVASVADQTWTAASGNDVGAVVVCYDPDTSLGADDSRLRPITKHEFPRVLSGVDLPLYLTNFYQAL